MTSKTKTKLDAIITSYLRAAASAALALYLVDQTRPLKDYALAGIAAVAGPLLKALDPKATQFGLGSK